MSLPKVLHWLGVTVLALASVYSILGVLQALSLFTGERALWNVNLWGSLALVAATLAWQLAAPPGQPTSRSVAHRATMWLQVALALYFAWQVLRHLLSVDACLDHGGSFDYIAEACNQHESLPFVPLHRTHGFPIVAMVVFGGLALRGYLRQRNAPRGASSAA